MQKIILSTDSTCDMGPELIRKHDVRVVPLTVILGDKDYEDGINIVPDDIYDYVSKTKILPKTSATSTYVFSQHFKKIQEENPGAAIIHFSISCQLSASYQNATIAAEQMQDVYVVDTQALSTGNALLILKGADLIEEGKSAAEIAQICRDLAPKVQTSFVVDNLDYLYKGGRCSGLTLLGANLLKIHPMLQMQNAYLKPCTKFRGNMDLVLTKYFDHLYYNYGDCDKRRAFVTQTAYENQTYLNELIAGIKEKFGFQEVFNTMAGSTITSHCGRGTIGLLYIANQPIMKG